MNENEINQSLVNAFDALNYDGLEILEAEVTYRINGEKWKVKLNMVEKEPDAE